MLYNCQTFLDIFGQIENETDFRKELRNLGLGNKNPWLEEFLYLMFERARNEKNLNIKYHEISDSQSLYSDTSWNTNQLCFTSVNGLLTDVCHIYKNGNFENSGISYAQLCSSCVLLKSCKIFLKGKKNYSAL